VKKILNRRDSKGQGMVEFAIVFPLLLMLLFGIFEFSRVMFAYSAAVSASREAARYGAAIRDIGGGIHQYEDCSGIREAAKRIGRYAGISDANITIQYSNGSGIYSTECPPSQEVNSADTISVTIDTSITPDKQEEWKSHKPEFTVISIPEFAGDPLVDHINSPTFILLNFKRRLVLIGNSGYGGEIKKSIFTALNYYLPKKEVLTMHCSANVGHSGDSALFFGLSGTGKTTLSADPERKLIGDDEHGWDDEGIFNFEDGSYAKIIDLSQEAEPDIFATTETYGTILENVIIDPETGNPDLFDDSITKNTRASYPLKYIPYSLPSKRASHPENIIFLTFDANGVMPPIARLSHNQALYHFISGYTSKVGGTEAGVGEAPELTFSACFGAPFMVFHPAYYADLLKRNLVKYNVKTWLINTGLVGGPAGIGKRISIHHTRALLSAVLNHELDQVVYEIDPWFGFEIPQSCPGVPDEILNPSAMWQDQGNYERSISQLVLQFNNNMEKYQDTTPEEVMRAGPTS